MFQFVYKQNIKRSSAILLAGLVMWSLSFPQWTIAATPLGQFDISNETVSAYDVVYLDGSGNYLVTDNNDTLVHTYDSAGDYVGVFADLSEEGAVNITGIDYHYDNDLVYIVDSTQELIYVYDGSGGFDETIDISAVDGVPIGITYDYGEDTFLILTLVDFDTFKIHEFNGTEVTDTMDISALVGLPSGIDYGYGYIWVTDDENWSVVKLDRNSPINLGELDISEVGSGNPTGLDFLSVAEGYLTVIDTGMTYFYSSVIEEEGGYALSDDDSYVPGLGWYSVWSGEDSFLVQGMNGFGYFMALRGTDIEVPQGATISSATLRLRSYGSGAGGDLGILYGHDIDDAPAWGGETYNPYEMATTSASVPFLATATTSEAMQDFDVTTIVQEIVNRPGWQLGNAIAFGGDPISGDASHHIYISSETATAGFVPHMAPTLFIDFEGEEGEIPARELRLEGNVRLMNGVRLF